MENSIEVCATVAARIAHRPAKRDDLLEAEKLTLDEWNEHHDRWQGLVHDEVDRGKKNLLSAYDTAYVAALEDGRGRIAPAEYARLAVAAERGKIVSALKDLDLPVDAMPRIRRVWLARMVKDQRLNAEVRGAMRAIAATS